MAETRPRSAIAAAVALSVVLGLPSGLVAAQEYRPGLTGKLETVRGVPVLRIWGSARDRGYTHGYLLADQILAVLEGALLDPRILDDPQMYESTVLAMVAEKMHFDPQHVAELDGMLAGITAARGPKGIQLERLNRPLTRADLEALNSLADWYRLACSSFSAWDFRTEGGQMITARNLDFFDLPGTRTNHFIVACLEPGPGKRQWVSIAWPGLIGVYTAMNEEGVTISMHDAAGLRPTFEGPYVPRSLALRDALEKASAVSAVEDVKRVLLAEHCLTGTNVHVSGPFMGQRNPAAVFEYDGDVAAGGGVDVRFCADENNRALMGVLLCTNHYRKRSPPADCTRFETMKKFFETPRPATEKIDVETARRVMQSVSVDGTLHSVVFLPNRKELYASFADQARNATANPPVRFTLAELLRKP